MSAVNPSEGIHSRVRTRRTRGSSRSASWASTTLPRRLSRSSKRHRLRGLPPANPSVPEWATELVTEQHRYLYRRSECFRIMAVPSPAPTGPPIPYWPSVVVKPDTVRGIQTYYVTLILDIIFGVFALIVGLSSILIVTSNSASAIAAAAITGSAVCGLVIVFVINFIVSLMAVIRMHHGADEYGPEHAVNARRGVLFKWFGTALSTLAAILVVYLVLAGSSLLFGGPAPAILYVPLLVTVFWTAGVSSKGQMYRFMIRSLQPPETRRWSDLASFLIPALGAIGIVVVGSVTIRIVALLSNPGLATDPGETSRLFTLLVGGVFLPPGFALLGYILFFWIVAKTKARVSAGLSHLYASVSPPSSWAYPMPMPPPGAATAAASAPAATPPGPPSETRPPSAPTTTTCSRCGFPSPTTAAFCANCGVPLSS